MPTTATLPPPGVSRATALDLVTNLSTMYANLQTQIAQHIAAELAKGITTSTWADQKLKAAGDMHRWTRTLLDRIGRDSSEEVSRTILEAYARGGDQAMHTIAHHQNTLPEWVDVAGINPGPKIREALANRGKQLDRKLSELSQAFPGIGAMQRVAGALHLRINGTHMPILRWTDDAYRQVVAKAGLTDVLAGTQTQRQTAQKVWEQLVGDGITGFTDKAGKRWNLASYVDMAVRTGVAHAAVEGHLDRLTDAGIDLVIVSNAPQECSLCRPWEGKILSRSGHGVTSAASAQTPEAAKATEVSAEPKKISSAPLIPARAPTNLKRMVARSDADAEKRDAHIEVGMADFYDGEYAGVHVRTSAVSVENGITSVTGILTDATGKQIGEFERALRRYSEDGTDHLEAVHEHLEITDKSLRGQGFAQAFNSHLEASYRHSGVSRIVLTANIDVGGYAWARQGYDFETERSAGKVFYRLKGKIAELKGKPGDHQAVLDAAETLLARFETAGFGTDGYPTPFEISELGRQPGAGRDDLWLGKETLLGSAWNAVKPL